MSDAQWPELSWEVPQQRLEWLAARTRELAQRARAFELALEAASEAGEAPLSKVAEDLELWEGLTASVWMYVGLGEAKQVPPDDVPLHAEELAKIYENLRERRGALLAKLGDAAQKVLAREAAAKVTGDDLQTRVGELPSFGQDAVDALGAAAPVMTVVQPELARPVTGEELRQRMAQESRPLSEPASFQALVAALPPPWVQCVFETIGLELPHALTHDEDDEEVELTVNSRTALQRRVLTEQMTPQLLETIVFAIEEEDRALLMEVLGAGGALRYADATAKYGKDEADGFFWKDRPPSGPVARLRRTGLAFVGTQGGRSMLVVPEDLRAPLQAIIARVAQ